MTATISTTEAARLLRVSDDTIRRLIARGEIQAVKCGRLVRVRVESLGALT